LSFARRAAARNPAPTLENTAEYPRTPGDRPGSPVPTPRLPVISARSPAAARGERSFSRRYRLPRDWHG